MEKLFFKNEIENSKVELNSMRVRIESLIHEKATTTASLEAAYKALESEKQLMEDFENIKKYSKEIGLID